MSATINKETKNVGEIYMAGWHLKKEVTITQIITLIALLVSSLWWASSVESRFVHVSHEIERVEQKQDLQMKHVTNLFNRIDKKLNKIEDKMDGKVDK